MTASSYLKECDKPTQTNEGSACNCQSSRCLLNFSSLLIKRIIDFALPCLQLDQQDQQLVQEGNEKGRKAVKETSKGKTCQT